LIWQQAALLEEALPSVQGW